MDGQTAAVVTLTGSEKSKSHQKSGQTEAVRSNGGSLIDGPARCDTEQHHMLVLMLLCSYYEIDLFWAGSSLFTYR